MWNIRSHACRFPVHTGTLTPSIAHPNRFLNHLKRFSAGFLTFRGGKIKKCTVSGDKINDFECAPGSWLALSVKPYRACQLSQRESPWHNGKVSGQTVKSAVPERTVTLSVTAYAVPAPPKGGAFGHLPVSANKAPPSGELAATSGSRLRGSAPSPRALEKPSGFD